jgi:drug/metabolite transporter (DMT)-like permease
MSPAKKVAASLAASRPTWKVLLAFSLIYFVWGSTFLAVRVGVLAVPPLVFAALRFTTAGLILYSYMRIRGVAAPTLREWGGVTILSTLIFLIDYGCLFWAERTVPSGVAAVVLATIPVFMAFLEIVFLRTQKLTLRLAAALAIGIFGVAVLVQSSLSFGEMPPDRRGILALLLAACTWSIATILARRIPQPHSKPMSAAAQMVNGGFQLFLAGWISGEFHNFHITAISPKVWACLIYLILFGSIAAFTAYVWLIHNESPTKVGTYAYVNPVVAVLIGHFLGGESLGPRTIAGTAFVLSSVVAINTIPKPKSAPDHSHEAARENLPPSSAAEAPDEELAQPL